MNNREAVSRVEQMVTGILAVDGLAQIVAAHGLEPGEEQILRAAGSIIAGLFTALGPATKLTPLEAWQVHMKGTTAHRERRQT